MKTELTPIPGHENYSITRDGQVFSNKTKQWIKGWNKGGYRELWIDGKKQKIHRLVAMTYVDNPNPEEYNCVDHINGIRTDNRASNLRWCTRSMNSRYELARIHCKQGAYLQHNTLILCIETGEVFDSISAASRAFADKFCSCYITDHLEGRLDSCKGYHFKRISK